MKYSIIEEGVLKDVDTRDVIDGCLDISDDVVSIGSTAFFNRQGINKIRIPKNLQEIVGGALRDCKTLKEVEVDGENEFFYVEDGCLNKTDYLGRIILINAFASNKISDEVVVIGSSAFENRPIQELVIPKNVAYIDAKFACNCKNLKSVKFDKNSRVRSVPLSAFEDCVELKSVELPDDLMAISASAFNGCTSLEKIVIPSKVTSINSSAFKNCKNLSECVIPYSIKHIGKNAFKGCDNLKEFVVEYEKGKFQRVDKEWLYSQFADQNSSYADFVYEGCEEMKKAIAKLVKKAEKSALSIGPATVLTGEVVQELNSKKSRKKDIQK